MGEREDARRHSTSSSGRRGRTGDRRRELRSKDDVGAFGAAAGRLSRAAGQRPCRRAARPRSAGTSAPGLSSTAGRTAVRSPARSSSGAWRSVLRIPFPKASLPSSMSSTTYGPGARASRGATVVAGTAEQRRMGLAGPRVDIDRAQSRSGARNRSRELAHGRPTRRARGAAPPAAVSGSIDRWARTWIVAGASAVRRCDDLHLRRDEPLDGVLPVVDDHLRRHASPGPRRRRRRGTRPSTRRGSST